MVSGIITRLKEKEINMQIQPVASQPSYRGKLHLEPGISKNMSKVVPQTIWTKLKDVAALVSNKPYDLFISQNKQNPEFFDVAANKSFKEAQKVKEYTVKIQNSIMAASIVDAAKDAMDMYEKYISKTIKG